MPELTCSGTSDEEVSKSMEVMSAEANEQQASVSEISAQDDIKDDRSPFADDDFPDEKEAARYIFGWDFEDEEDEEMEDTSPFAR